MTSMFRLVLCTLTIAVSISGGTAYFGQAAELAGLAPNSAVVNRGVVSL